MLNDNEKGIIYARYSSHGQTEQSIEGQLRDCYAFAEREGIRIVGEYIDRALTGRNDDRPDFQRMISDAAKKQFKYIIVWKLDRFSRNRYDSAMNKATLKKYGVRVISATENISDQPEGIMLEGMLESLAEYYSANLAKHVRRGQRESFLKGHYLGSIPPIGYKVVDKRLVIDEEKAPIIRFAFEQYAKGVSKKQIIEELTAKGVCNYYGQPLSYTSFQSALRNPKYIGKYYYNGEEVPGGCEAIISETVFNAVQERLDAARHAPAKGHGREDYLLQGKAYCGYCGTRLVGDAGTSRNGVKHHYYACGRKKKEHTCQKKNEKKGFLEWYVVEQTAEYVLSPHRMEFIATGIVAKYDDEFGDRQIVEVGKKLAQVEREINTAVDASLEAPEKVRPRYYEKIELLETQRLDIEMNLATLRIANGHRHTKEQIVAWLKSFCNGDPLDEDFQRRIIDVFINSVYVYDDKIVIYYNVKGSKQVSYIDMVDSTQEPETSDFEAFSSVRISNDQPSQDRLTSFDKKLVNLFSL